MENTLETRNCPSCNAQVKLNARFCHNCGTDMEAVKGPPAYPGAPVPVSQPAAAPVGNLPTSGPGMTLQPQPVWGAQPPPIQFPEVIVPSGYVARKLLPGERVFYYGRAAYTRLFDIIMVILLGPLFLLISAYFLAGIPYINLLIPLLAVALVLNVIGSIVSLARSELALTDRRVLGRWGRLVQHEIDLPLDWLSDVYGKASILTENYGWLYLATVGKSGLRVLDGVRKPVVFASLASQMLGPHKMASIKKRLARQQALLWAFVIILIIMGALAIYILLNNLN